MRFPLLFFPFLWCWFTLPAQSPSYVHYGVTEGLPSNKVYCAVQDHRGFIWFGTDKGLARFDGKHFEVFGVKEGLPDPEILSLYEDSENRLWISCFSQRPCYMLDGRLVTANNDSLLAKITTEVSTWEFSGDSQHHVFITSKLRYAYVFDGKSMQKEPFPRVVNRVAEIGGLRFGLGIEFVVQKETGVDYHLDAAEVNFIYTSIAVCGNRILYAVVGHLILLGWDGDKVQELARINCVEGRVYKDFQNRFWLCPESKGAICFDNTEQRLTNQVRYLPEEKVNSMLQDKDGTVWFCTSGHGVYALSPGKAATYTQGDKLVTNNITTLALGPQGQILAGDDGGNVYKFSGAQVEKTALGEPDKYNRSRQIVALPDHSYWYANDKGLFREAGATINRITIGNILFFGGFKALVARNNIVWYGNHNSLGYISPGNHCPVPLLFRRTTALALDSDNFIWAGGLNGLYSQRDSFQYNWGERFPELKSRIVAIQQGGTDSLWIVTPDAGLLLGIVKHGEMIRLRRLTGLFKRPLENIQMLFVEPRPLRRVWMATNSGVYSLTPGDSSVMHLNQEDGLADDDVNCVLVAHDTLWAGTVAGLSYFPLSLQTNTDDFGTFVTKLHYQSKGELVVLNLLDSLSTTVRQVVLPPDAAMLTLNLAGLNYRSQGDLLYECITTKALPPVLWWTRNNLYTLLKNRFQSVPDTTIVTDGNLIFGISLPSGSYHIQVTAATTSGVFSRKHDEWTVIMRPYWYNTVWFDLVAWSLFLYILWRAWRASITHRKLNAAVSDLQLQTLQSQINPHFVGNSINAIQQFFYPPNPAAASNYVELFTRLLRRTILLSERHFNSFEEELAYDRDYLKMIKLRFGDRFQYEVQGTESVPAQLPFPSMLLQPILENATIHGLAPEGISHLSLQFSYVEQQLQCVVTDNGLGYKVSQVRPSAKPVEHKSKGLELLAKKVMAFNQLYAIDLRLDMADLSETAAGGNGTRVIITFNPEKINRS